MLTVQRGQLTRAQICWSPRAEIGMSPKMTFGASMVPSEYISHRAKVASRIQVKRERLDPYATSAEPGDPLTPTEPAGRVVRWPGMAEQTTHGDTDLASRARRHLGRRHERFVVAQVVGGETCVAQVGVEPRAELEIGSVSKGITGMLFADSRARGETSDATHLGDLLSLTGAPAADITLGALATHTSGLPRLADGAHVLRATVELWRHGTNPYGEGLDDLLAASGRTRLRHRRPRYSNLGFMLLGHALAAAADTTYADLLHDRVTGPLGMVDTTVPATEGDLGPRAAQGCSRRGRPVGPWTGEALGPAGGIRSTAQDLGLLVRALLEGSAPGATALDPVARFSGPLQIGAAWLTLKRRGTLLTWHNGGTGGFRSVVVLDRAAGAGVALVSACARSVDRAGFALLEEASGRASQGRGMTAPNEPE